LNQQPIHLLLSPDCGTQSGNLNFYSFWRVDVDDRIKMTKNVYQKITEFYGFHHQATIRPSSGIGFIMGWCLTPGWCPMNIGEKAWPLDPCDETHRLFFSHVPIYIFGDLDSVIWPYLSLWLSVNESLGSHLIGRLNPAFVSLVQTLPCFLGKPLRLSCLDYLLEISTHTCVW
jgi:hypothetical protein